MLVDDGFADTLVVKEIGSTRHTTGQEQQVGIREVSFFKHHVCLDVHAMSRTYQGEVADAHRYNVNTATTQYVDGNQCFYILEAVS